LALVAAHATPQDWTTYYEASGYKRTPSYSETIAYCQRLADASPWVQYSSFGESAQGRALPLVIVDRHGNFTPEAVRRTDNVVFLIQAGIHSGEIDGKDAGLMLVRDIAITKQLAALVDHATILFIPIFNVDGHERFGPLNRPNQNGPEEMGWRTTAANLNLNRDYLKADAQEMRAWLALYRAWLPEFFADCHVTDGADYQYTVTYTLEVLGDMDEGLTKWTADRFLVPMERRMADAGYPLISYQWYRRHNDPRSGIVSWVATPRYSQGYTAVQNRPGLLIETHSLKDYRTRVHGTYTMLVNTLEVLGTEHETLHALVADADRRTAQPEFRSHPFPLQFQMSLQDSVMIDFLGVEYNVVESELTGGSWYRYTGEPVTYPIPYFNHQVVAASVDLPEAYIIPPEWSDVIDRLELHGVRVHKTERAQTIPVQLYQLHSPEWQAEPYEGRHRVSYHYETVEESVSYPAGSVVVDMNQRAARVAAHALEPDGPDSFLSWGFFDAIFEQKEYIETYVIEELARKMIEENPALGDELDAWKKGHTHADPREIRHWLYRRSPYWDHTKDLYPVGRILDRSTVEAVLD